MKQTKFEDMGTVTKEHLIIDSKGVEMPINYFNKRDANRMLKSLNKTGKSKPYKIKSIPRVGGFPKKGDSINLRTHPITKALWRMLTQ